MPRTRRKGGGYISSAAKYLGLSRNPHNFETKYTVPRQNTTKSFQKERAAAMEETLRRRERNGQKAPEVKEKHWIPKMFTRKKPETRKPPPENPKHGYKVPSDSEWLKIDYDKLRDEDESKHAFLIDNMPIHIEKQLEQINKAKEAQRKRPTVKKGAELFEYLRKNFDRNPNNPATADHRLWLEANKLGGRRRRKKF